VIGFCYSRDGSKPLNVSKMGWWPIVWGREDIVDLVVGYLEHHMYLGDPAT